MHRRWFLRFMFVARLTVALGCFQLSGYGHLVTDLLVTFGVVAEHDDDCTDEGDRECPPGCPTCHCAHCVTPALPAPRGEELAPPEMTATRALDSDVTIPSSPDRCHVYRPPRSTTPLA